MTAPVSRTGATDREVEAATAALRAAAEDPAEYVNVAVWQDGRIYWVEGHPADLAAVALKAARAAAAPDSGQDAEALAERLQQADPDGPYSALLDEPLEWDNAHVDRDYYRKFAAALLAEQPGGGK